MQEFAREPRRAKRVVEVVWKPFVGFSVDERITEASEASSGEIDMKASGENGGRAPPKLGKVRAVIRVTFEKNMTRP